MRSGLPPLLLCGFFAAPCFGAQTVEPYGYPFADPYEATVIGTPDEYRAELPAKIPAQLRDLLVFPAREVPDIFWYNATLGYSLAAQPGPARLVFILPGTGAGFDSSRSLILQGALYQAGFHVVSLSSPLHPNFIVAASTSSRPGLLTADAQDVHRVMALIRGHLADEIAITGYDLVGYSLGATQAAFVAKLDDERQSFGFERVLLINPPVGLYRAARVLDQLFEEHIPTIAAFNTLFNQLMQQFSEFYSPAEPMLLSDDLVYDIYKRRPPPDRTLQALIGAAFRLASMNLLFTSDVVAHVGVLVAPHRRLGITDSLTPYLKASTQLSFEDYARRVLYPYYREITPGLTFDQLVTQDGLRAIDRYLRTTPKIGLMHNADDILLGPGDLQYLEDVFGDRARIYPRGGHSGNLAYKDNIAYLIEFFTRGRR
jgi:pimeloyl-ACP methyl ester carboxylesterase